MGNPPPKCLPHGILGNVAKHYGIWVPPLLLWTDRWMDRHVSKHYLPVILRMWAVKIVVHPFFVLFCCMPHWKYGSVRQSCMDRRRVVLFCNSGGGSFFCTSAVRSRRDFVLFCFVFACQGGGTFFCMLGKKVVFLHVSKDVQPIQAWSYSIETHWVLGFFFIFMGLFGLALPHCTRANSGAHANNKSTKARWQRLTAERMGKSRCH